MGLSAVKALACFACLHCLCSVSRTFSSRAGRACLRVCVYVCYACISLLPHLKCACFSSSPICNRFSFIRRHNIFTGSNFQLKAEQVLFNITFDLSESCVQCSLANACILYLFQ